MNYLAHLLLSFEDPQLMMGNFIADDIAISNISQLPFKIQQGILLHRKIDAFTDNHLAWKSAVEELRPKHLKYAPVVIDILNDHLLSRHWERYHDARFDDFESFVYQQFRPFVKDMPYRAKAHVEALLEYKYLKAYITRDGLTDVMRRMDRRTKFPSDFTSSVDQLYERYDFYEKNFLKLMDSLVEHLNIMYKEVLMQCSESK